MHKAMIFLQRRPDVSRDAFTRWWIDEHRALAERLPGLRRHTFNLLPEGAPFDTVVEQWFSSAAALDDAYLSEPGHLVAADTAANVARRQRHIVVEHSFPIGDVA